MPWDVALLIPLKPSDKGNVLGVLLHGLLGLNSLVGAMKARFEWTYLFRRYIILLIIRQKGGQKMQKKKLSITIDEETSIAIDKASKAYHVPKSQLAREAFKIWLKKQTQELMAKGYEEMAKEDKESAELFFEAQREILP